MEKETTTATRQTPRYKVRLSAKWVLWWNKCRRNWIAAAVVLWVCNCAIFGYLQLKKENEPLPYYGQKTLTIENLSAKGHSSFVASKDSLK